MKALELIKSFFTSPEGIIAIILLIGLTLTAPNSYINNSSLGPIPPPYNQTINNTQYTCEVDMNIWAKDIPFFDFHIYLEQWYVYVLFLVSFITIVSVITYILIRTE